MNAPYEAPATAARVAGGARGGLRALRIVRVKL